MLGAAVCRDQDPARRYENMVVCRHSDRSDGGGRRSRIAADEAALRGNRGSVRRHRVVAATVPLAHRRSERYRHWREQQHHHRRRQHRPDWSPRQHPCRLDGNRCTSVCDDCHICACISHGGFVALSGGRPCACAPPAPCSIDRPRFRAAPRAQRECRSRTCQFPGFVSRKPRRPLPWLRAGAGWAMPGYCCSAGEAAASSGFRLSHSGAERYTAQW